MASSSAGVKIKNVKISLAVFFGLLLVSFTMFSHAQENATSNKNVFLDSDQDGLSDAEEKVYGTDPYNPDTDGDGYSDGEEVKSGYNPLVPAPNDKIVSLNSQDSSSTQNEPISQTSTASTADDSNQTVISTSTDSTNATVAQTSTDSQNITQELSSQVASLIQTKSASGQDISVDDLDNIVNQLTSSSSLKFEDLPTIDTKTIKIKKQDYTNLSQSDRQAKEKDDAEQYVSAVSYIFLDNSPTKITNVDDLSKLSQEIISQTGALSDSLSNVSYFENLAEKGPDILKQLEAVEVPENLVDMHTQGLQLVTYASSLKDKYKIDASDPISSILALSEVQNLMSLTKQYVDNSGKELNNLGITALPLNLQ